MNFGKVAKIVFAGASIVGGIEGITTLVNVCKGKDVENPKPKEKKKDSQ